MMEAAGLPPETAELQARVAALEAETAQLTIQVAYLEGRLLPFDEARRQREGS
jgi:hypothetical protein